MHVRLSDKNKGYLLTIRLQSLHTLRTALVTLYYNSEICFAQAVSRLTRILFVKSTVINVFLNKCYYLMMICLLNLNVAAVDNNSKFDMIHCHSIF